MAKEALFNILNNSFYFDDISVIDLFAGTGNISYEFASRGAKQITAVDQDFGCIKFINKTAEEFEMQIQTIKSDVFKYLGSTNLKANIIFADPPYVFTDEQFSRISQLIFQNDLLEDNGLLIVEHSNHTDLSKLQFYSYSKNMEGMCLVFLHCHKSSIL